MSEPPSNPPAKPEPAKDAPIFPLTPRDDGPLPGELVVAPTPAPAPAKPQADGTIPLAAEPKAAPTPKPKVLRPDKPAPVVEGPLWELPVESKGRRTFAMMVMLVVIGLYAWMLSFYYAGAHPGVDQAGYLMTARLIAGDYNVDNPPSPARPAVPATAAATNPAVWAGGAAGYTELHPGPAAIQQNPKFDGARDRLGFVPESPFQFSSLMNVMTEPFGPSSPDQPAEYRYYTKYPFGYPLLAAISRGIAAHWDTVDMKVAPPVPKSAATQAGTIATTHFNIEQANDIRPAAPATASQISNLKSQIVTFPRVGRGFGGMYVVDPLCTVVACFFAFFLFRQAVSSFTALIGVLWLATNPIVLTFAHDADSHAPTLMCVCIGFWGLVTFLRTHKTWPGWIGAFALGFACTIRYSEFMLVVPVAFAAIVSLRMKLNRVISSLSILAAWAIPVLLLGIVCWISFGSPTKTGYWYCNEETGFGWKYLTGTWPDRQMTANWETLLDQFNRSGLFMMWPLALAGLFGMLGASWRLGGLIAAWVLPTLVVYLSYYWAPALGDQIAVYYLRFFVGIIPGLLFAALWLLERALQVIHTGKPMALTLATAVPLVLLLVVAFYADGGPRVIDGGLGKMVVGMAHQAPAAVGHLFSASALGLCVGIFLLAIVPLVWWIDRDVIASRIGLAMAAGTITALGCAVNLQTVKPTMDNQFALQTMARANVENLREVLPRGTAIFGDNGMLQQMDCVGGWKLYDASAFYLSTYNLAMAQLAKRTSPDHAEEPYPMQDQRWQFYKELLTTSKAGGTAGPVTQAQVMEMERTVIEKNMAQGHKVVYVELADAGDGTALRGLGGVGMLGGNMRTFRIPTGFDKRMLRKWTLSAPPENASSNALSAFGPPRADRPPPATAPAPATQPAPAREGPTFILWEIYKP